RGRDRALLVEDAVPDGLGEVDGRPAARGGGGDQADHAISPDAVSTLVPQSTKTGVTAASRVSSPGSGASREAWSCTPSAVKPDARRAARTPGTRSRATSVTTTARRARPAQAVTTAGRSAPPPPMNTASGSGSSASAAGALPCTTATSTPCAA